MPEARARRRPPAAPAVLLPEARRRGAALPAAVPLLAALGGLVLFLWTLPAVRAQHRLQREHEELRHTLEAARSEVEALRREARGGPQQAYLRTKATRELLHRGTIYKAERDSSLRSR